MNISKTCERESVAKQRLQSLLNESTIAHTPGIEKLINEHEVAYIRGCSVATVRRDRLLRKGVPWIKTGALVRYRPSDVKTFIERNLRPVEA